MRADPVSASDVVWIPPNHSLPEPQTHAAGALGRVKENERQTGTCAARARESCGHRCIWSYWLAESSHCAGYRSLLRGDLPRSPVPTNIQNLAIRKLPITTSTAPNTTACPAACRATALQRGSYIVDSHSTRGYHKPGTALTCGSLERNVHRVMQDIVDDRAPATETEAALGLTSLYNYVQMDPVHTRRR